MKIITRVKTGALTVKLNETPVRDAENPESIFAVNAFCDVGGNVAPMAPLKRFPPSCAAVSRPACYRLCPAP